MQPCIPQTPYLLWSASAVRFEKISLVFITLSYKKKVKKKKKGAKHFHLLPEIFTKLGLITIQLPVKDLNFQIIPNNKVMTMSGLTGTKMSISHNHRIIDDL